ncbi:MAG: outer membrane lipoprotein carrier protein LolA [Proteobacteria bacterium]|nr:outer membrane lipoprotein carrier protein LolA [Pseudomonadota bacterium]MBU1686746.1 outer membrane lipoprotein carrier protein LolA [Pseudomonadota bacterium]
MKNMLRTVGHYPGVLFLVLMVWVVFNLMSPPSGVAQDESVPQIIAAKLQKTYERTTTFQADFQQVTSMKLSRLERKGAGYMVISKPGLMRWDYREPDQQVLICDGKQVSMYFAKSSQMIVMDAREYLKSDVTYAFFSGQGDLLRDFVATTAGDDFCCGPPPDLRLIPKNPHPQVDHLDFWINGEGLVERLQITDHFDSLTELAFTNIKLDQVVDATRFEFLPPSGTEIVEQ